MRRLIMAALIALIGVVPMTAAAQTQQVSETPVTAATDPAYPIYLGVGALAGVIVWNLGSLGWNSFPLMAPAGVTIVPEWSVAISRVWATLGAVVGAWVADGIYMDW